MSKEKEARQQAFKRWVEYDNKANELGDRVFNKMTRKSSTS